MRTDFRLRAAALAVASILPSGHALIEAVHGPSCQRTCASAARGLHRELDDLPEVEDDTRQHRVSTANQTGGDVALPLRGVDAHAQAGVMGTMRAQWHAALHDPGASPPLALVN
jgi:hypothetical protein